MEMIRPGKNWQKEKPRLAPEAFSVKATPSQGPEDARSVDEFAAGACLNQ
jgi:hypothetical protein